MARPKKEGMDYFPHDTDAVNDEKLEALRMLYGNDGYAFYFIMLERIYRTKDAELDISDAETIQILSRKVSVSLETFHKMLETCFKRDIFDRKLYEQHGVLTSKGIQKRVAPVVEKREKMRQKYSRSKDNGVSDAETEQKPDKVKESKGKESKVKESRVVEEQKIDATTPSDAIVFYQQNLGTMPPSISQQILDFIKDFGDEMVIAALNKALEQNKPHWGYAKSILNSWHKKGIKTLNQVKAEEVQFQNQRNSRGLHINQESTVPDWFKERKKNKQSSSPPEKQEDNHLEHEDVNKRLQEYLKASGGSS